LQEYYQSSVSRHDIQMFIDPAQNLKSMSLSIVIYDIYLKNLFNFRL